MEIEKLVLDLWWDIHNQEWDKLPSYFSKTAIINWHNTNECFSVDEFVLANSKYPGDWLIEIKKIIKSENIVISVAKVVLKDKCVSCHATSFFEFVDGKISKLDEYWGDDNKPPQWRVDMKIGKPIC